MNASGTQCTGGNCRITGCNGGFYDVDGSYSNGCECQDTGGSTSCTTPSSLGTLAVTGSTQVSGTLPAAGQEDWFTVTFTGNTMGGYHPHVFLSSNPGGIFKIDIYQNCTPSALGCGIEGGSSVNLTDWEVFYNVFNGGSPGFQPIPPVGAGGTIFIRVRRTTGGLSCVGYTLNAQN
jgi:hypothetical protein